MDERKLLAKAKRTRNEYRSPDLNQKESKFERQITTDIKEKKKIDKRKKKKESRSPGG